MTNSISCIEQADCIFVTGSNTTEQHPLIGTEALRTRRRIHHKLVADPDRWEVTTCFLCGRCDQVCPTGIGIKAVSREIVARFA